MLVGLLFPDADRVRRRLAQEFDPREQRPSTSPLFPSLPEMTLDMPGRAEAAPRPSRPRPTPAVYLADLLAQARIPCTPGQLAIVACGLGLAVGAVALWLGGPLLALPTAALAAGAPFGFVWLRVRA